METELMDFMIEIGLYALAGLIVAGLFHIFFRKKFKELQTRIQMLDWKYFYYIGMFCLGISFLVLVADSSSISRYGSSLFQLFAMLGFFVMYKELIGKDKLPSTKPDDISSEELQGSKG